MVCSLMHCCSSMARLASAMLLLTLYWGCHSWVWTRPTELVGALPPPPIDVNTCGVESRNGRPTTDSGTVVS